MARKKRTHNDVELPEGVRIRANRLRISFTWSGQQQQITLKMEPSARNIVYAGGLVQTVKREIELNLFDWSKHFPDHKYATPELALPTSTLIGSFLDDYIIDSEKELAGVTWDNYTYRIHTFLKPAFGHIPLSDLSAGHVRQWIKQQTVSRTTLKSYLAPLRSALKEAVLDEKIEFSPLDRFVWPKESRAVRDAQRQKKEDGGEVDPFNRAEIAAILNTASQRPQEHNIIQFGFWTGLRLEELFAVKWSDVDFVNGSIRVQRALIKRKGYKSNGDRTTSRVEIKGLKTEGSGIIRRDVVLMPEAIMALTAQKQHTFLMKDWIFHHHLFSTHWQSTNQFYNRFKSILIKSGVRHRQPYQMRHTWASMMLEAGEDEAWVAKMLGHVNTEMVRKVYRRFIPNGTGGGGYTLRNDWGQGSEGKERNND